MAHGLLRWFNKQLPQNFLIRRPYIGTLILSLFTFVFIVLYKPLHVHGARSLSLGLTIGAYCCISYIFVLSSIKLLKLIPSFSREADWTILKEVTFILFILAVMGIAIYLAGFLIEAPSGNRWNIAVFLDSCRQAFLIGIVPFAFIALLNYRFLFYANTIQYYSQVSDQGKSDRPEELIRIASQLKKEEVSFYPSQLVYAESDGNYVIFHLILEVGSSKKMVRNSISNIEQQLASVPYLMRTHRAFIVNLRKVNTKKGNTLGYRLKLSGADIEVPVSRQKTRSFDKAIKEQQ